MVGPAISRFLSVLSLLLRARGVSPGVLEILDYGAALVKAGGDVAANMRNLAERVQTMVDEGRDPTEQELAQVRNEREELKQRIRSIELPDDDTARDTEIDRQFEENSERVDELRTDVDELQAEGDGNTDDTPPPAA